MSVLELLKNLSTQKAVQKPEFIIAGLGNPGPSYQNTRHNAGFLAADFLAKQLGCPIDRLKFKALTSICTMGSNSILLMKPQTFMNESGQSISAAAKFYKIPPQNIVILFDDISLPCGKLRIRRNGSDGGHNGIKSIASHLSTQEFPRIKIGVGMKPSPEYDLVKWVLGTFSQKERTQIDTCLPDICKALEKIVTGDLAGAMNAFN